MSTSPTPEEREKKDKEDRAREKEEQAKLPYKWTQTIQDLDITVSVPANLKGRDIVVDMKKTYLKVGVKGQDPIIDVRISALPPPQPPTPLTSPPSGPPTSRNPPLRKHLDPRTSPRLHKRNIPPPRQNQQNAMVGLHHHQRPLLPRHLQNPARELEAGRSGRRDEGHGGENDV